MPFRQQSGGVDVGLDNLGNTCYANTVIQCLRFTDAFARLCCEVPDEAWGASPSATGEQRKVFDECKRLVRKLAAGQQASMNPSGFLAAVAGVQSFFAGMEQHDAHEFMRCVLDLLHEATQSGDFPARSLPVLETSSASSSDSDDFVPVREIGSAVADIFRGSIVSEMTCSNCGHVSRRREPFFDVSCPLPAKKRDDGDRWISRVWSSISSTLGSESVKLEDCFEAFANEDDLEGTLRCGKCRKNVQWKRVLRFERLPQVLCVYVKRFRYNSSFFSYGSKIGSHVEFPLEGLDLSRFLDGLSVERPVYDLYGVINHRGGLRIGHYTCYCRTSVNDEWLAFDDNNVHVVSEKSVAASQAYVLFYQRRITPVLGEGQVLQREICEGDSLVPRLWSARAKTLEDAGPIELPQRLQECKHGIVGSAKWYLFEPVEHEVAKKLQRKCGGMRYRARNKECESCKENRERDLKQRKEEKTFVCSFEKPSPTAACYIICLDWWKAWEQYVSGSGAPPGPIRNGRLLRSDGETPRKYARNNVHYTCILEGAWKYLVDKYGGGPALHRCAPDLHADEPE